MKYVILTLLIVWAVLTGPATVACQPEEDAEAVQSPTQLLDLLPEGGIAAIDIDYWMISQFHQEDGSVVRGYKHVTIGPDRDGGLLFVTEVGNDQGADFSNKSRVVYSKEGELQSVDQVTRVDGKLRSSVSAVVEGDTLAITTKFQTILLGLVAEPGDEAPPGKPATSIHTENHRVPMSQISKTIQQHLLPLVHAYHLRQDISVYQSPLFSFHYRPADIRETLWVQRKEAEDVRWNDRAQSGYRLRIATRFEGPDDQPPRELMEERILLADGTPMGVTMQSPWGKYISERATEEEVRAAFDVPPGAQSIPEGNGRVSDEGQAPPNDQP